MYYSSTDETWRRGHTGIGREMADRVARLPAWLRSGEPETYPPASLRTIIFVWPYFCLFFLSISLPFFLFFLFAFLLSSFWCALPQVKDTIIDVYSATKVAFTEAAARLKSTTHGPFLHINVDLWTAKCAAGRDKYIGETDVLLLEAVIYVMPSYIIGICISLPCTRWHPISQWGMFHGMCLGAKKYTTSTIDNEHCNSKVIWCNGRLYFCR